jgi:hypothetical protein
LQTYVKGSWLVSTGFGTFAFENQVLAPAIDGGGRIRPQLLFSGTGLKPKAADGLAEEIALLVSIVVCP